MQQILLPFYQKALRPHLSESQYLTLELLLLLLQSFRRVKRSRLASLFSHPIQYERRLRNLQRFLILPKLSLKLLWFPVVKYWIRQEFKPKQLNRAQRRRLKQLRRKYHGYLLTDTRPAANSVANLEHDEPTP